MVPPGYDATRYLREQTYIGARARYPAGIPVDVQALIEHELELIAELKFEAYFLTVYDIVQFARGQGILCQGRGSAPKHVKRMKGKLRGRLILDSEIRKRG
ncbi:hypothetical protein WK03_38570 [Burkholderia cepacia]|nr:hypothetical protein WK03_38570 [Burkholderia cepacia]